MRTLLKALFILVIFKITAVSCCNDPDTYSVIKDFSITLHDYKKYDNYLNNNEITNADTLTLDIRFDYFYEANFKKFYFNENCYALKCEEGEKGIKNKIKTITITSSTRFNNIAAGESLNEIVTCTYNDPENEKHTFENTKISNAIDYINTWEDWFLAYNFEFNITKKPINESIHKFKIKIEFANGDTISKESEQIIWK